MVLTELPHAFLAVFAVAFGLALGSFLNVVIYRVPRGLSVVNPPSACPACGKSIRFFDNIPLLSWLLLGGKARCCGVSIPVRYPLVELLGGVLGWAVLECAVLNDPTRPLLEGLLLFAVFLFFSLSLTASVFIDFEHMLLPDEITWPLACVGLLSAPLRAVPVGRLMLGAALAYLMVWLPFIWLYRLVRGHPGMGLGDAKLLFAVGCWFGLSGAVFSLLAGAVQGTLMVLIVFLIRGRVDEPAAVQAERRALQQHLAQLPEAERQALEAELAHDPLAFEPKPGLGQSRLAFGPFLALSALEYMIWGDAIASRYFHWIWAQ